MDKRCKRIMDIAKHISLALLLFSFEAHSEIYKWTDANGKVHYSDRKPSHQSSQAEKIKIDSHVNSIPRVRPLDPAKSNYEEKLKRQRRLEDQARVAASENSRRSQVNAEKIDPRCRLARDILSGDAVLRNGLETGQHEIEVAKRDVRKFCK